MSFPFRPLYDRVVIKRAAVETKTAGGLFIPDTASSKEKPDQGVVIAVGTGNLCLDDGKTSPMSVKVGEKVLFSKYAGTEIKVEMEDYIIVRDGDILAVIE